MKIYSKYNTKMNGTSIHVKIIKSDECIYENTNDIALNTNGLTGLISRLKDTQIEINNFLTALVEKQDTSTNVENPRTSESDSDLEDEIEVNPKKSKLID